LNIMGPKNDNPYSFIKEQKLNHRT